MPLVDGGWTLGVLMKVAKPFLRQKLRERLLVCKGTDLCEAHGYQADDLPTVVGGTRELDAGRYEAFLRERLAQRAKSIAAVRI
jgi:hypothetical protein